MEEEKLYGKLFNSVPLYTEDHLDLMLQTLDKENAIQLLILAVKTAYHQNIYSLGECEVISKSIRVVTRTDEVIMDEKKDGE
jgi:hypothetical protein